MYRLFTASALAVASTPATLQRPVFLNHPFPETTHRSGPGGFRLQGLIERLVNVSKSTAS